MKPCLRDVLERGFPRKYSRFSHKIDDFRRPFLDLSPNFGEDNYRQRRGFWNIGKAGSFRTPLISPDFTALELGKWGPWRRFSLDSMFMKLLFSKSLKLGARNTFSAL